MSPGGATYGSPVVQPRRGGTPEPDIKTNMNPARGGIMRVVKLLRVNSLYHVPNLHFVNEKLLSTCYALIINLRFMPPLGALN